MSDFDKDIDYYNENRDLKRVLKNHEHLIDLQRSQLQLALSILAELREIAREDNNYQFSDYVRDELKKVQITFRDKKKKK